MGSRFQGTMRVLKLLSNQFINSVNQPAQKFDDRSRVLRRVQFIFFMNGYIHSLLQYQFLNRPVEVDRIVDSVVQRQQGNTGFRCIETASVKKLQTQPAHVCSWATIGLCFIYRCLKDISDDNTLFEQKRYGIEVGSTS